MPRQVNCTLHANHQPVPVQTPVTAWLKSDDVIALLYDGHVEEEGRLIFHLPDDKPYGGATIYVELVGYEPAQDRVVLPPENATEGPAFDLVPLSAGVITTRGDKLYRSEQPFMLAGSTELEAAGRIAQGHDLRPIFQQRKDAGANTVRILGMHEGIGWLPTLPNRAEIVQRTFELAAKFDFVVIWPVLNGTKQMMPNHNQQADFFAAEDELTKPYLDFRILCVGNEINHGQWQDIDPYVFTKPAGVSSRGSYTTDHYPEAPLWDVLLYGARRDTLIDGIPEPGGKPFNNMNPYEFYPRYPQPVPHIAVESLKPPKYGHDPTYARQMGKAASLGTGAFFHAYDNYPGYPAWGLWPPAVESCARAFYAALEV